MGFTPSSHRLILILLLYTPHDITVLYVLHHFILLFTSLRTTHHTLYATYHETVYHFSLRQTLLVLRRRHHDDAATFCFHTASPPLDSMRLILLSVSLRGFYRRFRLLRGSETRAKYQPK